MHVVFIYVFFLFFLRVPCETPGTGFLRAVGEPRPSRLRSAEPNSGRQSRPFFVSATTATQPASASMLTRRGCSARPRRRLHPCSLVPALRGRPVRDPGRKMKRLTPLPNAFGSMVAHEHIHDPRFPHRFADEPPKSTGRKPA